MVWLNKFSLQELAEQAAAKALELQQAGEGLRLSVDQEQRLQEVASLRGELEKLKAEHSKEVDLLQRKLKDLAKEKGVSYREKQIPAGEEQKDDQRS